MPIEINRLRKDKGGDVDAVRDSEVRRGRSGSIVDKIISIDDEWRKCQFELEQLRKDQNAVNKEISSMKKAKQDTTDLIEKSTAMKKRLPELEKIATEKQEQRDLLLHNVGNIIQADVLASNNEDDNPVLRTWGVIDHDAVCDGTVGKLAHYEILQKLGGVDLKKGGEIAGHRGYFLIKYGCMLNQALLQYGISFLRSKGYVDVQPPFFMKRNIMAATAELKDFEETLYKIPAADTGEEATGDSKREDLFMIATSEQPISALHMGDYLSKELPIKYAGISTCFRKEAGSHGKDMRGIFRIHQFEKVEQFILCDPAESGNMHEEMIKASEEFYQSLQIPYRVVSIVAGAINDAASKKYDLEAWFLSYQNYRELVSCSNCTDYQSRALNIRHGVPKMMEREKQFVHMLNGTLTATERTMCCVLEHYQTPTGVKVPRVLQPYMEGLTFLPYPDVSEP